MIELGGPPVAVALTALFVWYAWSRKPHSDKPTSPWVWGDDPFGKHADRHRRG